MFFIEVIFALFVAGALGYLFWFVLPRPNSIHKELAGNRLRIEFVAPPSPTTPLQTVWFRLLGILDGDGYVKSLEVALWELDKLFRTDSKSVHDFLALKEAEALHKFLKLVGCTAFELSKKKRTEQDLRNLEAVFSCLRLLADIEEGRDAIAHVKDGLYDIYHATFYALDSTRCLAFSILGDMLHHSEQAFTEIVESMVDCMYNPIKEDFMFAQLFDHMSNVNTSQELLTAIVNFLTALVKSKHAGEHAAMFRHHFEARQLPERLQAIRGRNNEVQISVDGLISDITLGDKTEPSFHTTPYDIMSNYSHMFKSRIRFFTRVLGCLWTVLPGVLPPKMKPLPEEVRTTSVNRMKFLRDSKRTGTFTPEEVQAMNREMSALTLGVEPAFFDDMMKRGMFDETRKFVDQAEGIENWNHEELLQAGRNVWTCFGLQMILYNEDVRLQNAYVGYSLLYPYTDNYLDDETIPKETKLTFQELFTKRLAGKPAEARSALEQKIWDMVSLVESVYDRSKFPDAFNSMISINEAQTRSLAQHSKIALSEETLIDITMEKGGTSVIADGYLVHGEMTEEEALFAFGFGVCLQLVDDLQDTLKDTEVNHQTLFTHGWTRKQSADVKAYKSFQLLYLFIDPDNYDLDEQGRDLRRALLKMTHTIMLKAVAKYCYIFTEAFVEKMAQFAPIPIQFLQRVNNMARMLQMVRNNQI